MCVCDYVRLCGCDCVCERKRLCVIVCMGGCVCVHTRVVCYLVCTQCAVCYFMCV